MSVYEIPSALELRRAEQVKLPTLTADDPIFELFPIESVSELFLRWVQKDNFGGLQQVRGLGGKPGRVNLVGDKQYLAQPGVYGEFVQLDEVVLTQRRDAAMLSGKAMSIRDLVGEAQDLLLHRRLARIKQILWTLLTTGTFSVSEPSGSVVHTDSFSINENNAAVAWATYATARPLYDIFTAMQEFAGQSVAPDSSAYLFMNRQTAYHVMMNSNSADLGGKHGAGGQSWNSVEDVNKIFIANGLPPIRVYEGGYHTDAGVWTRFCPDGVAMLVAKRTTGSKIGSYRMTLNQATASSVTGPYTSVIYKKDDIPASIEVHDGHNGGPTLEFPGAIIKIDTTATP
jgi:hypothetical protein